MSEDEERIRILSVTTLSNSWKLLQKTEFDYRRTDGRWQRLIREVYDRGNGAVVLLYNRQTNKVVLTRQFRFPAYVNGHHGMLIEACAGLLDEHDPETCIRKETEEETGYWLSDVRHLFTAFMSPGSVTEKLHFFAAEYDPQNRAGSGGGLETEGEDIEVIEIEFSDALAMIESGEIADAKTIMLLQHAALHGLLQR